MPIESLRITEFSDREFLLIMVDCSEDDGWASSDAIAERMDLAERRIASSRLSWLRRYGAVEREHERDKTGNLRYHKDGKPRHTQRWKLTALGEAVAYGDLRKGDQKALDRLQDGQMLLVTRWLSERTTGESGLAKLVQREWRFGHARR